MTDTLRQHIRALLDGPDKKTLYAIAKGAGVQWGTLQRFVEGNTGLHSKQLDKIADFLRLDLAPVGSAGPSAAPKRKRS